MHCLDMRLLITPTRPIMVSLCLCIGQVSLIGALVAASLMLGWIALLVVILCLLSPNKSLPRTSLALAGLHPCSSQFACQHIGNAY